MAIYLRGLADLRANPSSGSYSFTEGTVSKAQAIKGLDCLGYFTASAATTSTGIAELRPAIERLGSDKGMAPVTVALTSSQDLSISPASVADLIKENQCALGRFDTIFAGVTGSLADIIVAIKGTPEEDTEEAALPVAQVAPTSGTSNIAYWVIGGAGLLLVAVVAIKMVGKKKA